MRPASGIIRKRAQVQFLINPAQQRWANHIRRVRFRLMYNQYNQIRVWINVQISSGSAAPSERTGRSGQRSKHSKPITCRMRLKAMEIQSLCRRIQAVCAQKRYGFRTQKLRILAASAPAQCKGKLCICIQSALQSRVAAFVTSALKEDFPR